MKRAKKNKSERKLSKKEKTRKMGNKANGLKTFYIKKVDDAEVCDLI